MATQFHEDFHREGDEPRASERSFGLVFAGFFALIGIVLPLFRGHPVHWWAAGAALAFLAFALLAPRALRLPNRLWAAFGRILNRIVSPVVMGVLFIVAVVPTGIILRLSGRDPLRLKLDRNAATYWQKRSPSDAASFTQQF